MLHKLNLLPLTVFLFVSMEDGFRRGMTDGPTLDSPPEFIFDFICCFPSESAKKKKETRNEESTGDIFTNSFFFCYFVAFGCYFIVINC